MSKGKIKILLIAIILIILYLPTFKWMNARFSEPESFYAHGFLLPFIVAYLIYDKRKFLKESPIKEEKRGRVILIASLCVHLIASYFEINFISGFSLIGVLWGLVLYNGGFVITKVLGFPLFFMVFMVPLPKATTLGLSFYMKMFAAKIASFLIAGIVPLKSAGSLIYLPNGVLTVGAPCSGLKSLISLAALSLLFAHLTDFSLKKKAAFFLCALPIAFIGNIVRIMLLILAFYVYGSEFTMGKFHDFTGFLVFVIAFIGLTLLRNLFLWQQKKSIV